ncbi:MAG: pyridoxal 5'-phosphate synthase glutaminase subunit PdxT [Nitriliruptoraceae bacterium]|nr:pyridoxal 5'-phosphate synthase glutaminase subunit PdxT [Nitriliruptoraceae bacterium]
MPGERLANRVAVPEPRPDAPRIGVLALQGDVLEHLRALRRCGADAVAVRDAAQLAAVDGLILPGGESTTIGKLLVRFGLLEPLQRRIAQHLPVFGTCAGMILLSDELDQDTPQPLVGGLHVRTRRNAFGRQLDSFDTRIEVAGIDGGPLDVAFIRAPRIEAILAEDVEVWARVEGHPVVVRQGHLLAAAFHPEVTGDDRLHARFVAEVRAGLQAGGAAPDGTATVRPPLHTAGPELT